MLDAANLAYHNLLIGKAPKVIVDKNGERVEFTQSNKSDLLDYINALKSLLDASSVNRAPLTPFF